MPVTFTPPDNEFAAASGSNVNWDPDWSYFDHPPNSTTNLTITSNMGDENPFVFETGETYDLTWDGHGGGIMEDATIIRSDYLGPGQGAIVFEGVNSVTGEMFQMVWSPGFDLEEWYWSNGGSPSSPKAFWTSDQDTQEFQYVCYCAGTMIATPGGAQRIENLRPGHMITAQDNGAQEIRWIGAKTMLGVGAAAPVVIQPGVLDNDYALALSQQHRVLISGLQADIYFGAPEVWVPAKSLINDGGIYIENRRQVTYYHLMLSGHEVLIANGQPAESFYLGDVARNVLNTHERQEVAQFFPEVATSPVSGAMQSARMMLKPAEARFLAQSMGLTHSLPPEAANGRILAA